MANSFLDLIGLAHFKEKQSQQISKEFAKKSEVVTKAEASDFAKHKTCSARFEIALRQSLTTG